MTESKSGNRLAESGPTWSLFEEAWWLDCVAPGAWQAIEVHHDGRTVARMPYLLKGGAVSRLSLPPLTPWLGPCVVASEGKGGKALGQAHEWLAALIEQMPAADIKQVFAAPEQTNMLPFHWAGFELRFAYTYRLGLAPGEKALWDGLRENIRREVRKAQRQLVIRDEPDPAHIIAASRMSFERQKLPAPDWTAAVKRIVGGLGPDRRTVLTAWDGEGRLHGAVLLAHDHRHCFYLMGGADPALRTSGAQSLLLWESIRRAIGRSAIFDFEGSMNPGIERFFRAFGAVQTLRLSASRATLRGKLATAAHAGLRGIRGA